MKTVPAKDRRAMWEMYRAGLEVRASRAGRAPSHKEIFLAGVDAALMWVGGASRARRKKRAQG